MTLTMAVGKNGVPFKKPPPKAAPEQPLLAIEGPPKAAPKGTPPWKQPPPSKDGSSPMPKDGSGA